MLKPLVLSPDQRLVVILGYTSCLFSEKTLLINLGLFMLCYTFSGIFIRVMWKLLPVNKQLCNIKQSFNVETQQTVVIDLELLLILLQPCGGSSATS
jgi:hypothetical protein